MTEPSILNQFQGFLDTQDIFPKNHNTDITTFEFPEVDITNNLIADLEKLDHPRNSVLGKRMESFFEIAIKYSSRYELIDSNIQIIHNKQTLGELDFLIFDKHNSTPLHIELVYKLYVYDQTFPSENQRWIGPNRRDSFSMKLEKLKSKQFPLLYKPETSIYLNKLGLVSEEIKQQLCFKAQLFIPKNNKLDDRGNINPECYSGKWFKFKDFLKMNWQENLFHSPKKKNWSCDPGKNSDWMSQEELLQNIEFLFKENKAPLVWMKTKSSIHSFFIVWW
ncbi:DUF1853 family protein [Christiangramia forsetii]|uniref:Protein containing DUF1853 n=2 Tax=Christiangramia forsetii TaxID=411153 RepID=A0M276_CHRFK|nr:DUF1853 family protein [Christiangramia forsetii]GGG39902.1 hypothetical protein GCM10011532_24560 [Christiangramia forsetii]CAL66721.1 conserved hypothetical protein [Christiangramia forsetii KT0803]